MQQFFRILHAELPGSCDKIKPFEKERRLKKGRPTKISVISKKGLGPWFGLLTKK